MKHTSKATSFPKSDSSKSQKNKSYPSVFTWSPYHLPSTSLVLRQPLAQEVRVTQPLKHRLQRKQALAYAYTYGGPCYPDTLLRGLPQVSPDLHLHPLHNNRSAHCCSYQGIWGLHANGPSLRGPVGSPRAKSIFTKTLSHHLTFSLSFFHLCIVGFPETTGLGNATD